MKKNLLCLCTAAFVMLGLPWAAVEYVSPYSAMIVCVLLLYVVNPICACGVGITAGKCIKKGWHLPMLCTVLFIVGAWVFLRMGIEDMLRMACVYLVVGYLPVLGRWLVKNR